MRTRRAMATMAAVLALVGACGRDDTPERDAAAGTKTATPRSGAGRDDGSVHLDAQLISTLEAFDECDDLLSYLRTEAGKIVGPYGFGGGRVAYPMAMEATAGPSVEA